MKRVELMAPARNLKAIKAAIPHADSVYFGVKKYNMRMKAENIDLKELPNVVHFCHSNDLKCYLTTNILIYDNELPEIRRVLQEAKNAGIDAVIVHDIAVLEIARSMDLPFHISTQCNVSNSLSAKFYEDLGAKRIILARELS
ncbi:MAG: peptidase U32 family protein, partial [Promethearchaeota archaeon]